VWRAGFHKRKSSNRTLRSENYIPWFADLVPNASDFVFWKVVSISKLKPMIYVSGTSEWQSRI